MVSAGREMALLKLEAQVGEYFSNTIRSVMGVRRNPAEIITTGNKDRLTGMCQESGKLIHSSSANQLLSVVVPARNEERSIGSLITSIDKTLSGVSHEVIVVDDASTDGTSDIVRSLETRVVVHERNRGKGYAMQTGVHNATGDIIVFLDGDGAHDPLDIPRVVAPIRENEADLVIGSRALPGSRVATSPMRRKITNDLASFVITFIISFLVPLATWFRVPVRRRRITDCTSGFRAVRKSCWQKLNLVSEGFQIETEMIYEAVKDGMTIAEVPIACNWDSSSSRLSILRDGLKTLRLLLGKLAVDSVKGRASRHGG